MKDIQMLYENCKSKLDHLGIKTGVVKCVKVNNRAARWGRCRRIVSASTYIYEIEISGRLLDDNVDDKAAETTMIHELLHTCNFCLNHGAEWKRLAEKVNKAYGYNIKRTTSAEEKGVEDIRKKYAVVCEKCGTETTRMKMSNLIKHPEFYVCCRCGGNLKRLY